MHRLCFAVCHSNHARLDPSRIVICVGFRRVLGITKGHCRSPMAQPTLNASQRDTARQRMNRERAPEIVYYSVRPAEPLSNSPEQSDGGLRGEGAREDRVIRSSQDSLSMLDSER